MLGETTSPMGHGGERGSSPCRLGGRDRQGAEREESKRRTWVFHTNRSGGHAAMRGAGVGGLAERPRTMGDRGRGGAYLVLPCSVAETVERSFWRLADCRGVWIPAMHCHASFVARHACNAGATATTFADVKPCYGEGYSAVVAKLS